MPVNRSALIVALSFPLLLAVAPPVQAGVLSLSIVGGITDMLGGTQIPDPVGQESLSSTTLTQLGTPLMFDPTMDALTSLTVRVTNTSDAAVLFPEFLPGVSVMSGLNSIPGYSSKLNVGAGGTASKNGLPGQDGAISRTVLDTTYDLFVEGTPGTISNGGAGGAGTGVAENWIALKGASGDYLSPFLAGKTLNPGEWIDIPGFAAITQFHRSIEDARFAFGFDLPTFSSGGISVTTGAWSGSCGGPGLVTPPPPPPASVPEPASVTLLLGGLALGATRRRLARAGQKTGQDVAGE
jgi:hypothetical protein